MAAPLVAAAIIGAVAAAAQGGAQMGYDAWKWEQQKHEAAKQRDFQYEMSHSYYQYTQADLRAAGLNPILAATGGQMGVPQGAMASSSSSPSMPDIGESVHSAARMSEIEEARQKTEQALAQAAIARDVSQAQLNTDASQQAIANTKLLAEQAKTQQTQQQVNSADALYRIKSLPGLAAQSAALLAQASREASSARLNDAQTAMTLVQKILQEYEVHAQGISHKTQRYTRPAQDVVDILLKSLGFGAGARALTKGGASMLQDIAAGITGGSRITRFLNNPK